MAREGGRSQSCVIRAAADPNLLRNPQVLTNLIAHERRQVAEMAGCRCLQPEITEDMLKMLAHWLLEVSEDQLCEEVVFPLAMTYVRRSLSIFTLEKKYLQLLGTVCLLLASKMRDMVPVKIEVFEFYTAGGISAAEIRV
ncbi:G1/S-specific cyclin-D3 [Gastrophryne carolinensis]